MNNLEDVISGFKEAEELKQKEILAKKLADKKAAMLAKKLAKEAESEKTKKLEAEKQERMRIHAEHMAKQNQVTTILNEAYAKIREAEALAEKLAISFDFDLAYGMGGTYYPTTGEENSWRTETGWVSSSANC